MRLILILFLPLTLGLSAPSQSLAGLFETNIEKARDLAKIEKKYEAKKLLDEAILEDPLDADVHYEAGLVYAQLGMSSDFDLAMKNACKLKSSYCPKVAEPYYSMGFNHLNGGSQRSAIRAFEKAFQFNPQKKAETLQRLFDYGSHHLLAKDISTAERYFYVLLNIDIQSQSKIADIYFENALNSSSYLVIALFRKAIHYSDAYKEQAGHNLAEMAKDNNYSENWRSAFKKEAGKYLSKSEMLAYFPPDYRELKFMELYSVALKKKGDISNIWIRPPQGSPSILQVTKTSKNYGYILRSGDIFKASEGEFLPNGSNYDVKIIALKDNANLSMRFAKQ